MAVVYDAPLHRNFALKIGMENDGHRTWPDFILSYQFLPMFWTLYWFGYRIVTEILHMLTHVNSVAPQGILNPVVSSMSVVSRTELRIAPSGTPAKCTESVHRTIRIHAVSVAPPVHRSGSVKHVVRRDTWPRFTYWLFSCTTLTLRFTWDKSIHLCKN